MSVNSEVVFKNDNQEYDLITAASVGDQKMVECILKSKNVDPNMTNSSGWTALMYAAHYGHFNVVRTLIQHRCQVDYQERFQGKTALMLAAINGHTRCIETLIRVGRSNKDIVDYSGNNAAYYAKHYGHGNNKIIKALLDIHDSSTSSRSNRKTTPYQKTTPKITVTHESRESREAKDSSNMFTPLNPKSLTDQSICSSVFCNKASPFWVPPKSFAQINNDSHNVISTTLPPSSSLSTSPNYSSMVNLWSNDNNAFSTPSPSVNTTFTFIDNDNKPPSHGKLNSSTSNYSSNHSSPPLPNSLYSFLSRIGLQQYYQLLEDNGIDLYSFMTLTDDDLITLGITLYGHRKTLTIAQARFHESMDIRSAQERLFADWLINERDTLLKKVEKLEEHIKHCQHNYYK